MRARNAESVADLHSARLQPIDPDRLLVTHLVLETNVDILAAFEHLLGGLRKARLVAVERRGGKESGQDVAERHHDQHDRGVRVRAQGKVDDPRETARGSALHTLIADRDRHLPIPG